MATGLAIVIGVALLIGFIINAYVLLRAQREMALVAGNGVGRIIGLPRAYEPLKLDVASVGGPVEPEWLLRDKATNDLVALLERDLRSSSSEGEVHE